jgi:hypothetical protein
MPGLPGLPSLPRVLSPFGSVNSVILGILKLLRAPHYAVCTDLSVRCGAQPAQIAKSLDAYESPTNWAADKRRNRTVCLMRVDDRAEEATIDCLNLLAYRDRPRFAAPLSRP